MKKLIALVGTLSVLGGLVGFLMSASDAQAQSAGSCCVHTTSKLDDLLNPIKGGDESFFTSANAGLPNVIINVDNSGSMFQWPFDMCSDNSYDNGCGCPALNSLGYSPAVTYPKELNQINSSGNNQYLNDWFQNDRWYDLRPTRNNWWYYFFATSYGNPDQGPPAGLLAETSLSGPGASDDVCDRAGANAATCRSCVASKGYYFGVLDDGTEDVMSGNFLNFFAPKYLMARKVLKEIIREIRPLRMSLHTFWLNGMTGGTLVGQPPTRIEDFNPRCGMPASNFDSNRQSFVNSVNGLRFGWGTPLTRALLMAGYAFNNAEDPLYASAWRPAWYESAGWPSAFPAKFLEGTSANSRSVCSACAFSAVILLTDGEPNDACEGLDCGGSDDEPGIALDVGTNIAVSGCTMCGNSKLDELARFLWTKDVRPDYPGKQSVATYTIAFGLDPSTDGSKILQSTATAGGGEYFNAKNGQQLKAALFDVFESINTRNTSFSSANVASLQTADTRLSAIVPRMSPATGAPWSGQIYRFEQYNEFVQGNDLDGDPDGGPGYKSEIFMLDRDGDIIFEDQGGVFVKKSNANQVARPFWEASKELVTAGYANRNIYTVVDSDNDGRFTETDDEVLFNPANVDTLMPYMGLAAPGLCPNVATGNLGSLFSQIQPNAAVVAEACGAGFDAGLPTNADGGFDVSQAAATRCCAKVVIDWIRGRDVTSTSNLTRADVLGDIFHSSPVQVDPPAPRFICDLGISNQCVRTLYSQTLGVSATPLASYTGVSDVCSTGTNDAYDEYVRLQRTRDRLVVVGANDGMLHAFHNGDGSLATITDGGTACLNGVPSVTYTSGTGKEAWAFIPPDQLPRLHERILRHTYSVDGDTMVRDIWADSPNTGTLGTKDYSASNPEYKTLIVSAEGRGGNHYFALEAKFDSSGNAVAPDFRWIFPQPCSPESMTMGKTLYSLAPKPPPIGPVLIRGAVTPIAGGGTTVSSTGGLATRYGGTTERWVAALSGGWSPALDKGRGVYLVDAWTGTVNGRQDNLWWKFEFDDDSPDDNFATREFLVNSVAAPIALVDYGENKDPRLDGYFDTGVFGDTAGQLWLTRMFDPGTLDATTGLINNWVAARVFETDNRTAPPQDLLDVGGSGTRPEGNRWPFFYLPSTALQQENGALRAFIGSGNRYAVLEDKAGTCRYDNPQACSKYGCGEVKFVEKFTKMSSTVGKNETHWKSAQFEHGKLDRGTQSSITACGTGAATATGVWDERKIDCSGVPVTTGFTMPVTDVGKVQVECGKFGPGGEYYCRRNDTATTNYGDWLLNPAAGTLSALGMERFYGVHAYGAGKALSVRADAGLTELPVAFDNLRLTDRGGPDGGGNLVNVTNTTCGATSCTGNMANPTGQGWFLEYPQLSHKTGSGSALLASCVLWSSVYPGPPVDAGCSAGVQAGSNFYQADFITGAPNCAAGFMQQDGGYARSQARTVLAPPAEPATAIMIGPNGQIRYSALLVEPGQEKAQEVNISGGSDILQSVYELPVSKQLHDCRHGSGTASGCAVTP